MNAEVLEASQGRWLPSWLLDEHCMKDNRHYYHAVLTLILSLHSGSAPTDQRLYREVDPGVRVEGNGGEC